MEQAPLAYCELPFGAAKRDPHGLRRLCWRRLRRVRNSCMDLFLPAFSGYRHPGDPGLQRAAALQAAMDRDPPDGRGGEEGLGTFWRRRYRGRNVARVRSNACTLSAAT